MQGILYEHFPRYAVVSHWFVACIDLLIFVACGLLIPDNAVAVWRVVQVWRRTLWTNFARNSPVMSRLVADWGWAALVLAALGVEEAHEYGLAMLLVVGAAASLLATCIHWKGIDESSFLTTTIRAIGLLFSIAVISVCPLWIWYNKDDQPWSRVPSAWNKLRKPPAVMTASPKEKEPPQNTVTETSGTQDKIKVEVHHAPKDAVTTEVRHSPQLAPRGLNRYEQVQPNNEIFAELICDSGFMFIEVPRGSTAYILTLRDNLTAELVTFTNTDAEPYRWPESTEQPLLDRGLDCAITNSSKETFLNIQADFIVEFDAEHPLVVAGKTLHTFYIGSLEPGKSHLFHVVNQSRFFTILNPPDKFPARLLGFQQPRMIPLVRRKRDVVDAMPIGLFRSIYKWQGNKVVGPADMPH